MNFYFFASNFDNVKKFDESGFEGVLFTYNIGQGDFFTKISVGFSPDLIGNW